MYVYMYKVSRHCKEPYSSKMNMDRVGTCRYQPCVCPASSHLLVQIWQRDLIQSKSDKDASQTLALEWWCSAIHGGHLPGDGCLVVYLSVCLVVYFKMIDCWPVWMLGNVPLFYHCFLLLDVWMFGSIHRVSSFNFFFFYKRETERDRDRDRERCWFYFIYVMVYP